MKQEDKVESLDTCICELQQQTDAQRLKLENAHISDMQNLDESKFDYMKNWS